MSERLKILAVGVCGLMAYTTALACSCVPAVAGPLDQHFVGELRGGSGGGCGGQETVRATVVVTEAYQNVEVGDTIDIDLWRAPNTSCSLDYHSGDLIEVVGRPDEEGRLPVNLCNSWRAGPLD